MRQPGEDQKQRPEFMSAGQSSRVDMFVINFTPKKSLKASQLKVERCLYSELGCQCKKVH